MADLSGYDRLAQFYDWEHRSFREDIPFYLGLADRSPRPVLDAACGTGRITIELAKAGHSVVGVDSSRAMLAIARERARGLPEGFVQLVLGDLASTDLSRQFGLAIVGLGSFHHLLALDDQRAALSRLAANLGPAGLLVIDLVNPSPEWLAAGDGALVHQLTAPFPDGDSPDLLTKMVARTTQFDTQTESSLLIYDRLGPNGALTRRAARMETRFLFRYEAELLLAEAGFRIRDLYGGYDMGSYQACSTRMLFVAERP